VNDEADPPDTAKLPVLAQPGPYEVEVVEGRRYLWCSCGLSATQPWCDGSHEGTGFEPIAFVAPLSAVFHMCGCKRSENKPYCFGTCRGHKRPSAR
jgi:CDGSH-type Zn-finger protein